MTGAFASEKSRRHPAQLRQEQLKKPGLGFAVSFPPLSKEERDFSRLVSHRNLSHGTFDNYCRMGRQVNESATNLPKYGTLRQTPQRNLERGPMKLNPILLFSLVAHLLVMPAFAQSDSRYEVSAGYSFLAGDLEKDRHGFVTSFTHRISGRFGVETEVGGNYRKEPFLTQNDYVHSILA